MCKQNNYKIHRVILTFLFLTQTVTLYATENLGDAAEKAILPYSTQASDVLAPIQVQGVHDGDTPDSASKPIDAQDANSVKVDEKSKEKSINYFDILEFQVEGNTKLTQEKIETAVYPHMGEKKTIDDVEKARDDLEKAYHQAGFLTVLVDIPEQEVNKKIVKLNVTEGKVSKLRIKDSHYYSLGRIKELSPSVKEGQVPYFPGLQQDVTRLNRTADRRVTPILKAGKEFGTVDVELKVEDKLPLHASLELNDRYSQDTTRWRLGGTIHYDNLWQRDHSLSLSFQTSPENIDEVQVVSANYLMRFDESDLLLALYGVHSKSNVATLGGINILGNGTILGVRLIKPLPSVENYFHSISFGADYKDYGQTVQFGDTFSTPITYTPLSASYSGNFQGKDSSTQFTTGASFGMRGLVSDEKEFSDKRPGVNGHPGAKPNFFIAKAEVEHTHALPKGFEGYIKLDGFFSGSPLISNEQYLAGGADTVRGYLEAEASGDQAVHSTLEIRSPQLFKGASWLQDFKAIAFYDIARLKTIDAGHEVLSGTGLGLRIKAFKYLNLDWDVAVPLKDSIATKQGEIASHMRLWYEF
jgi:hemolysin activation/secretion protein